MQTFIKHKISVTLALGGFALALLLGGCKDSLLNQTPRGQQTVKNFFRNKDDAIRATNATYQRMKGFNILSFAFLAMTDIASDDAVKGSTPGDAAYMERIHNFNFDASNTAFISTWNPNYSGIYRANQGIQNIPNIDMDKDLRARLVGENKFLRAYYYFFLVKSFGGVPLIRKPLKPGEFDKQRASLDSTYTFIINDLKDAANALPAQYDASNVGRATKGAANAYLAKVYLFRHNYQKAEEYAQKVITSGQYSLLPSYNTLFTKKGENTSGTIFSIQAAAVANGTGGNAQYSQTQGVRGKPNLGYGFNLPSHDLVQAYEPGDPRMETTILFDYEELPDRTDAVRDNANIKRYYKMRERYNQKAFAPLDTPGGTGNSGVNVRKMRYADVLLMAAEADAQMGNTGQAQKYVNMVRKRARDGQSATLGIEVEPVSAFLADTLNDASIQNKPLVRFAQDDGPAASAGVKSFDWNLYQGNHPLVVTNLDVIQSVNGKAIKTVSDYKSALRSVSPGQTVSLAIRRFSQTTQGSGDNVTTSTSSKTINVSVNAVKLLPDITSSGQQLLDAIYHERRVELAMEQHRFFDLRREGRAMKIINAFEGRNYTQKNDLYPIPQQEVDFKVKQNPGYSQ